MGRYLLSVAGWMIACLAAPVVLFIFLEPLLADMAVWLRAVAIVGEVLFVLVVSPVAGLILNNCIEKMKYGCLLENVRCGEGMSMSQEQKRKALERSAHRWILISVAIALLLVALILFFLFKKF